MHLCRSLRATGDGRYSRVEPVSTRKVPRPVRSSGKGRPSDQSIDTRPPSARHRPTARVAIVKGSIDPAEEFQGLERSVQPADEPTDSDADRHGGIGPILDDLAHCRFK